MKEELNALLEAAKDIENPDEFEKLPDGEYIAVIDKVGFGESKAKNLKFTWEFKILEGKYINRREWSHQALTSPAQFKRLVTNLEKFGINTTSYEEIEKDLPNLLDVKVNLIIKTSDPTPPYTEGFRNFSITPCDS